MRGETLEPLVYLTTKLRTLDGKLTVEQARRLVALPRELGFESSEAFLAAFRKAIGAEADKQSGDENLDDQTDDASASMSERAGKSDADTVEETEEREAAIESIDESSLRGSHDAEIESGTAEMTPENEVREVDDNVNARVKALVEAGRTRAEIAKELGLSVTQVQKARKALGLGRSSGKRAAGSKSKSPRRPRSGRSESGR
jgi:hypothetical protein